MSHNLFVPDDTLDLTMERVVDVSPALVWKAWTEPAHLMKWFTPAPWRTIACEIDLRPGGRFHTVMLAPDGTETPNEGCYLEVTPEKRLIWTDAFGAGYRPAAKPNDCFGSFFVAVITLAPEGNGTRYHVLARHSDEAARKAHLELGFVDGWGTALDQLVAHMKSQ